MKKTEPFNVAQYLNIAIPAPRRLDMLRKNAAYHSSLPHSQAAGTVYTWRNCRHANLLDQHEACGLLSRGMNGNIPIAYCHDGPAFGRERFADEIESAHIRHRGWYVDDDGAHGTIRGLVVALPHGRFLSGYYSSDNDERVYYLEIETDEADAARYADGYAERMADEEREYNGRWNAAQDLEDKIESNFARLRECLALRNNPCFAQLRDEARDLMESIRKARETLKSDYADVL